MKWLTPQTGRDYMEPDARIYIAGHRGLVGSAILRRLEESGFTNLILRTRSNLDLTDQTAVNAFFEKERPEYVFLAAAKVGGILANDTYPADFLHENLAIQNNVIDTAHRYGVKKLLFLGSSCIYPKHAPQPIKEEHLLTGSLEPTNQWYAIAKIAGIKMCQAYRKQFGFDAISVMPTNLYGPNDNFDLETSHVLPALLRKVHEAKQRNDAEVVVWGTGNPRREFLHVDDLAEACLFLMKKYSSEEIINIGYGTDVKISELVDMIKDTVGFHGQIKYDADKPDGTPRKLMDSSKVQTMGWNPKIDLQQGLKSTYDWFLEKI